MFGIQGTDLHYRYMGYEYRTYDDVEPDNIKMFHLCFKDGVEVQLKGVNGLSWVAVSDSTGTTLNTGETLKIAGSSNVTTAVSGDTLTITGPDLSGYALTTSIPTKTSDITNDSGFITTSALTNYAQKTDTAITIVELGLLAHHI